MQKFGCFCFRHQNDISQSWYLHYFLLWKLKSSSRDIKLILWRTATLRNGTGYTGRRNLCFALTVASLVWQNGSWCTSGKWETTTRTRVVVAHVRNWQPQWEQMLNSTGMLIRLLTQLLSDRLLHTFWIKSVNLSNVKWSNMFHSMAALQWTHVAAWKQHPWPWSNKPLFYAGQ